MITQVNSAIIRNTYTSNFNDSKNVKNKTGVSISKQGDTSRVEQLKDAIDSGEYRVDLQALSQKIAEELL
jgi:anti-sigma28 factor (negative regulator of flagellin synthesis)